MRLKPALARPEAEDVPGPGAYHNARTSASGPDSPSAPAYTMGSRTSAMAPEGPEAGFPGPGSYQLPVLENGPAFTIRARHERGA